MAKPKKTEIEIVIPKNFWDVLKYILGIFIILLVVRGTLSYLASTFIEKDASSLETEYPQLGVQKNVTNIEKSVVFIIYKTTACCDSTGQPTPIVTYGSGVIYAENDTTFYVITSRHVVDCIFDGSCISKWNENVTIRTNGGTFYNPSKITFAPHDLDLVILTFHKKGNDFSSAIINQHHSPQIGDDVVAIGYPAVVSYPTVLEFSETYGTISQYRNFLTSDGFSFKAIETDAIVNPGNSGGGLFTTEDGNLIGIVTWKDYSSRSGLAIDFKTLQNIDYTFISCPNGYYLGLGEKCYQYSYCPSGTTLEKDLRCYKVTTIEQIITQTITYNCPEGYVFGIDNMCHSKCGDGYCSTGSVCCNDQCRSCPSGYYLATDCYCYPY